MTAELSDLVGVDAFARKLLGSPLWPHQLEAAESPARLLVLLSGRQAGKSRLLAVLALHEAATRRNRSVLLVSAGEVASQRLLEECGSLASASPLLRGSVLDESKSSLTLSNGSVIRSVPASARQIRGWAVDLLILDEAAFLDPDIWRAAEPTVIAREGSRVVLASSPWGTADHFFRALHQRGTDSPDEYVAAWTWPSSISPLVSVELLEQIRQREPAQYFEREFLARFPDEVGAFFKAAELEAATGDFEMTPPERGGQVGMVIGGVDWGSRQDSQALSVIARVPDLYAARPRYRLVWCEAHAAWPYSRWIERLAGEVSRGFRFAALACEVSGVGDPATEMLRKRLLECRLPDVVVPVVTTARSKEAAFGLMRILFQDGRLELPRHPELLRQLAALQAQQLEGGGLRIAVPERLGHDDLALSASFAVAQLAGVEAAPVAAPRLVTMRDVAPEVADYRIEDGSMDFGMDLL